MTIYPDPSAESTPRALPKWHKPKVTLDTVANATGSDLNAPGDDGLTIYPGIDLGNFS